MCYFFLWTLPPPPILPLFLISGLSDVQHMVMRQKMYRFSHFLMRKLFVCRLHDWNLKNKENASKKKEHWRWTATCKLISNILTTDSKKWTKEFEISVLTEISVLEITNFSCNMMGHLEALGSNQQDQGENNKQTTELEYPCMNLEVLENFMTLAYLLLVYY